MGVTIQVAVLTKGAELKFVSDSYSPEAVVDCGGCAAPCCRARHLSAIPLSLEEAQKLPHTFGDCQFPNGAVLKNTALLARHPVTGGCVFVTESGKCSIWEIRPRPCRIYSCLTDKNQEMAKFSRERFGSGDVEK